MLLLDKVHTFEVGMILLLRRVFFSIYRKTSQTIILLLLITMICTLEFSGIILYTSAQDSRTDILRQIGASISIGPNQDYVKAAMSSNQDTVTDENMVFEPMTTEILNSIRNIPHVMGYDEYNSGAHGPCTPIDFNNVKKYTGVDPETQKPDTMSEEEALVEQNYVYLVGTNDASLFHTFRAHLSRIISGRYPDENNRGVLISSELADENQLSVGDEITLKYAYGEDAHPEITARIVGIYETSLKFEILPTNSMGAAIFQGSPYNMVFTDYSTACSVTGRSSDITLISVYCDSPEYLQEVISAVSKLPINWNHYQINNDMQNFYTEYAGQINNLIDKSLDLIIFSMVAGIVLFIAVISFWNKNYINDMGILISLGESKRRIVLQRLAECLIIALLGIVLSVMLGYSIISALSVPLTPQIVSSNAANTILSIYTGEYDLVPTLQVKFSWLSVLENIAFGVALVVVSTIIPMILTLRYNVRRIFEKAE